MISHLLWLTRPVRDSHVCMMISHLFFVYVDLAGQGSLCMYDDIPPRRFCNGYDEMRTAV